MMNTTCDMCGVLWDGAVKYLVPRVPLASVACRSYYALKTCRIRVRSSPLTFCGHMSEGLSPFRIAIDEVVVLEE